MDIGAPGSITMLSPAAWFVECVVDEPHQTTFRTLTPASFDEWIADPRPLTFEEFMAEPIPVRAKPRKRDALDVELDRARMEASIGLPRRGGFSPTHSNARPVKVPTLPVTGGTATVRPPSQVGRMKL